MKRKWKARIGPFVKPNCWFVWLTLHLWIINGPTVPFLATSLFCIPLTLLFSTFLSSSGEEHLLNSSDAVHSGGVGGEEGQDRGNP